MTPIELEQFALLKRQLNMAVSSNIGDSDRSQSTCQRRLVR